MRSNLIGMCSAVAAVAVAGSAMAGAVDTFGVGFAGGDAVNGVISGVSPGGENYNTPWQDVSTSSPFNYRLGRVTSQGSLCSATISGNAWTSTVQDGGSTQLFYSMTAGWPDTEYVDSSQIDPLSFTMSNVSGNGGLSIVFNIRGKGFGWLPGAWIETVQNGTYTFSYTALAAQAQANYDSTFAELLVDYTYAEVQEIMGPAQDYSKVSGIEFFYQSSYQSSGAASFTMSNFVPAPGAIALLGAAGIVGMRRRRN